MRFLVLVLLLVGCQAGPSPEEQKAGTVLASKPGFDFEIPPGWVKDPVDPSRSWKSADGTMKLRLTDEKMPAATLETVARGSLLALENSSRVKDFKLVKKGPLELGRTPAHEIVYFATLNGRNRWHREILAQHQDQLVTVVFLADPGQEDAHQQDFAKVLETWHWQ